MRGIHAVIETGSGKTAQPAKLDGLHPIDLIRQADTREVNRICEVFKRCRAEITARFSGNKDVTNDP